MRDRTGQLVATLEPVHTFDGVIIVSVIRKCYRRNITWVLKVEIGKIRQGRQLVYW